MFHPHRLLNRSLSFIFVAALTLSAAPVLAATPYYIEDGSLPPTLLAPPPAEDSPAWKKDMSAVRKAQAHIGKKEFVAIRDEQHLRLDLMTCVIGPDFTPENYPNTFLLLDHALADSENVSEADKAYWNTRRPYLANHAIKLLVDPINSSPAYPSGHATGARVIAEVLGILYPDKLATLRARANEIAWHRIVAGVHYPTDITGGQTLAMLVMGAFTQSDDFNDDLAAAQVEIAQKK